MWTPLTVHSGDASAESAQSHAATLSTELKTQLVRILAAVTPLTDLDDVDAVERELGNLKTKADLGMQEVARLSGQLDRES